MKYKERPAPTAEKPLKLMLTTEEAKNLNNTDNIQWPGWRVVRLIGRGSFGAVYEIERDVFGDTEHAALKVITIPENAADIEDLRVEGYDDESITTRFQGYLEDIVKEYSTMAKMKGHPNVVYCDDVKYIQHDDGIGWDIYIKMELLTPIMKCLERIENEQTIIDLGIAMCNALVLCRERNIVHRDIKPQNIFVSQDGTFKLGDFGIAKTAERTTSGTKVGTYKYMAPEVYNNRPYGPAADQYSLGLVMYWLLNDRRTPFSPKKATATEEDLARKRRFDGEQIPPPAHGSKQLQAIVLKACAYDPKQRYSSAAEMLNALRALKDSSDPAPATAPRNLVGVATDVAVAGVAAEALTAGTAGQQRCITTEEGTISTFGIGASRTAAGPTVGAYHNGYSAGQQNRQRNQQPSNQQGAASDNMSASEKSSEQYTAPVIIPSHDRTGEEKEKKRGIAAWIAIAAGLLVLIVGITLLAALGKNKDSGGTRVIDALASESTEHGKTLPVQLDWAEWAEALPDYVTDENYDIEERTLYSSRNLETTSSTTSSTMDGWELYETANGNGDYGPWSDWTQNAVNSTEMRQVDTQTQYRYSEKEITTDSSPTKSGWELYDTSYTWGDYGAWSEWSIDYASSSESRKVEAKTQYRYRDISYVEKYTDWSSWSAWQSDYVSSGDLTDVQTRTVYGYYWYQCPNCGAHMHGWGFTCPTWAGGCGKAELKSEYWHVLWSTTPPSSVSFGDWYGTTHYYAYVDGVLVFRWDYGNPGPQTQYSYRTRSTYQEANYGSWSSWGDTNYSSSSNREVESRTVYRYCDRSQVATYHFYRWGDWSSWKADAISSNNNRKVEEATFYRYRDKANQTTYYFRRWTDWSEFTQTPVDASDTVDVQMKTQYRFKSKGD